MIGCVVLQIIDSLDTFLLTHFIKISLQHVLVFDDVFGYLRYWFLFEIFELLCRRSKLRIIKNC